MIPAQEMMNPTYRQRIHTLCPDLTIETITLNNDGLVNEVVIVNNTLAFRFAKSEYSQRALVNNGLESGETFWFTAHIGAAY